MTWTCLVRLVGRHNIWGPQHIVNIAGRSSRCPAGPVSSRRSRAPSPQIQFLEEIISLVVDDDEGREILDLDAPDRFHAEFGIFHHLNLLDAVLGEVRRRSPIEPR